MTWTMKNLKSLRIIPSNFDIPVCRSKEISVVGGLDSGDESVFHVFILIHF